MSRHQESTMDAGLLVVLQSLPDERLAGILEQLGITPEQQLEAKRKADPRRCRVCGYGYVYCRQRDEKTAEADRHEWSPDRSRAAAHE